LRVGCGVLAGPWDCPPTLLASTVAAAGPTKVQFRPELRGTRGVCAAAQIVRCQTDSRTDCRRLTLEQRHRGGHASRSAISWRPAPPGPPLSGQRQVQPTAISQTLRQGEDRQARTTGDTETDGGSREKNDRQPDSSFGGRSTRSTERHRLAANFHSASGGPRQELEGRSDGATVCTQGDRRDNGPASRAKPSRDWRRAKAVAKPGGRPRDDGVGPARRGPARDVGPSWTTG